MAGQRIQRALVSAHDKTGLVDLARVLVGEFGVELVSTGGTADLLRTNAIPVTLVEDVTGSPEMLDGRVKTLHPAIHGAILADRDNPAHMQQLAAAGIKPIDLVVVNLYPFEKTVGRDGCTFAEAIEMIDIGGPCLLRAAAKNHRHVAILRRPEDYAHFLDALRRGGGVAEASPDTAAATFAETSRYDAAVMHWLERQQSVEPMPSRLALHLRRESLELRYAENPHQRGGLYRQAGTESAQAAGLPAVEGMSFNNYLDAHAALSLCRDLNQAENIGGSAVCCFIKHNNACGAGVAEGAIDAYERAYLGDPNAAMGGVLACSFDVDEAFAAGVMDTYARWGKSAGAGGFFVEVWIAPRFDDAAVAEIRSAKPWGQRVRLLSVGGMNATSTHSSFDLRCIAGGMLVQERDELGLNEVDWKVVTKRPPSDSERRDLRLAWLVCKQTRSNAVGLCRDGMLLGNGAGQMSRVMSCRIATWLAHENSHSGRLAGSVAASDAFFPFADGPRILLDAGVTALIQPGGSKRDDETIALCNERGASMIFTGTRHFRH
ncbi:MAG: bifunctional phosphoribosylaminoimidazolecarboxamide formyltransferase/IMP cyclohydrolase [Phycisphaerae bacterium]|nr:bifunctional phosphoribosylaminoimidazolecarboxamide formyltransferase/IMP cyclohydrolase [Phycisphaerae bacterium]